jgi:peptidylprolyl isomerase
VRKAAGGDTVKVHYTGRLDDGSVFDSSKGREPLEFTIGRGRLIRGFEEASIGMSPGESRTVRIPSGQAYGPHSKELVIDFPKDQFPTAIKPEEGLALSMRQPDGSVAEVVITGVSEDTVTLDANHPLAGKDLTFEIEMVEIE